MTLHTRRHTCCCSGVPGDSEASTKETQGQDEAQKVDALAVLWQVSLSMQLSPRRSQTERVVDLLASYRYMAMGSQLQAWKAFRRRFRVPRALFELFVNMRRDSDRNLQGLARSGGCGALGRWREVNFPLLA